MEEHPGKLITEGKTKIIRTLAGFPEDYGYAEIESKDDITAGDGAKHDVIENKAALATRTTSNVFGLLARAGMPVAFIKQSGETKFVAERCEMIPYEVVIRREAYGSFLKRNPEVEKGFVFEPLVTEFFLKTNGKKWDGIEIPKDDPLVIFESHSANLYLPDLPVSGQMPFMVLTEFPLKEGTYKLDDLGAVARDTFLILEKAWKAVGKKLVDFKVEFGTNQKGELLLADVIDNDSWRLIDADGSHIDKQLYRDGGGLNEVTVKYKLVAELTETFKKFEIK